MEAGGGKRGEGGGAEREKIGGARRGDVRRRGQKEVERGGPEVGRQHSCSGGGRGYTFTWEETLAYHVRSYNIATSLTCLSGLCVL